MKKQQTQNKNNSRRSGAALVEFTIVAPLLITLVLGVLEIGIATRASTILTSAVREGGRLASMDFGGKPAPGETANQKVKRDIKNFITASGLNGDKVLVSIRHEGGSDDGANFILEDTDNNLKLFRIRAKIAYADVTLFPLKGYMKGRTLAAVAVFRATKSSLAQ